MLESEQLVEARSSSSVLEFRNVCQYFHDKNGGIVTAAEDVNLSIKYGKVVALVGESGSGKTTLGRLSVGLGRPSKGEILLNGKNLGEYKKSELRGKAQYIHQDPYSALDPYLSVREVLERPLIHVRGISDPERREQIITHMLDGMGLESFYLAKSVRELSGGQKQRILVARAFVIEPEYVVADEPTTMVDFVRRNEIVTLLKDLKQKMGTSVLLITHDVSVASQLSDEVAVMYKGEIVEYGMTSEVLKNPLHPYTLALLSVTPEKLMRQEGPLLLATKRAQVQIPLKFEGCRYSFVCPYAFDKCRAERPKLIEVSSGHKVACFKVTG
ncbi:MAG: ABC transporter ATP-binding protein [Nitrososphaerales archaeon]